MKTNKLIILSAILLTVSACKKDNSISNALLDKNKLSTNSLGHPCPQSTNGCPVIGPDTIAIKVNPNNPFDYAGFDHNAVLDYMLNNVDANTPQSYSLLLNMENNYYAARGIDTVNINNALATATQLNYYAYPQTTYADNPSLMLNAMYNNGAINDDARNYFNQILSLVQNVSSDEQNSPDATMYNTLANNIIAIENYANNDQYLTTTQKQAIFSVGSIARYSSNYWCNYIIKDDYQTSHGGGNESYNGIKLKV